MVAYIIGDRVSRPLSRFNCNSMVRGAVSNNNLALCWCQWLLQVQLTSLWEIYPSKSLLFEVDWSLSFKVDWLTHSLLCGCWWQALPDSIKGLVNLVTLDVQSNQLRSLPDAIGSLSKLKNLNVSGNLLKALPDSLAGCRYGYLSKPFLTYLAGRLFIPLLEDNALSFGLSLGGSIVK